MNIDRYGGGSGAKAGIYHDSRLAPAGDRLQTSIRGRPWGVRRASLNRSNESPVTSILCWTGTDHGRRLEGDRRRCLLNNFEAHSSHRQRSSPPREGKPPPNNHVQMAQSCGHRRGIGEVASYFPSWRSRRARPQESFAQSLVDSQGACASRRPNQSDGIPSVLCKSS